MPKAPRSSWSKIKGPKDKVTNILGVIIYEVHKYDGKKVPVHVKRREIGPRNTIFKACHNCDRMTSYENGNCHGWKPICYYCDTTFFLNNPRVCYEFENSVY